MADGMMELFALWERIDSHKQGEIQISDLLEHWEESCWRMQIHLLLAREEKISYLNALAALSDRIYNKFRKQRSHIYLRLLLEKLGALLIDRDIPDKYRRSILKITISERVNILINEMAKSKLDEKLFDVLKAALKDLSTNIEPSSHLDDYLKYFGAWLKKQKAVTSNHLIDQLISINFNHPAFLEFMFNQYESAQNDEDDIEKLKQFQVELTKKQLHLDLLKLRSSVVLFKENVVVAIKLQSFLVTEFKWVELRLNKRWRENISDDTLNMHPNGLTKGDSAVKMLAKWPADKSDLVELVYGLYVYMRNRGSLVTIAALVKWCEDAFGVSLTRYSHRFAEIKMRKSTRPSKFLDIMVNEFLNYVEEGNAFEPGANR